MTKREKALASLGLSPPLLALVNGELAHPAIPEVCRPVRRKLLAPRGDGLGALVPLWEDATGTPEFFDVLYAKRTPAGPEFYSVIYEQGDEPCTTLLARTEQGLLFWLFYWFMEREESDAQEGWNLPALASTLGFHYLQQVAAFRRACADGLDYHDRLGEVVLGTPAGPPTGTAAPVERLMAAGEKCMVRRRFADALGKFQEAWSALPQPPADESLAVRILAAIGDCHFHLHNWYECHQGMQGALQHGASVGDVFIRLRLGQSLYELGNEREAANWLVPVYLTEGRAPFAQDDLKYLEFFRTQLKPPAGGWPAGW